MIDYLARFLNYCRPFAFKRDASVWYRYCLKWSLIIIEPVLASLPQQRLASLATNGQLTSQVGWCSLMINLILSALSGQTNDDDDEEQQVTSFQNLVMPTRWCVQVFAHERAKSKRKVHWKLGELINLQKLARLLIIIIIIIIVILVLLPLLLVLLLMNKRVEWINEFR